MAIHFLETEIMYLNRGFEHSSSNIFLFYLRGVALWTLGGL